MHRAIGPSGWSKVLWWTGLTGYVGSCESQTHIRCYPILPAALSSLTPLCICLYSSNITRHRRAPYTLSKPSSSYLPQLPGADQLPHESFPLILGFLPPPCFSADPAMAPKMPTGVLNLCTFSPLPTPAEFPGFLPSVIAMPKVAF